MSTTVTTRRFRIALAAAALAVTFAGGIGSALAQTAGGNRGGGGGGVTGESTSGGSEVLVYGTAGNCPPTLSCGTPPRRPPIRKATRPRDVCGDYRPGTAGYRQCLRPM